MQQIPRHPTSRLWCLSGLAGMVLLAGILLGEGQARTYTPSPVMTSSQVNKTKLRTSSSKSMNSEKSRRLKSTWAKTPKNPSIHKQETEKNPAKKRMGLAILLLGIVGEES